VHWTDEAFVLSIRKHGETSVIAQLLTLEHGRHAGLVRGGGGIRARGVLQPGNRVTARWGARLSEHLGTFTCELVDSNAAVLLADPDRLAVLSAACAVAEAALAEREPHARVYRGLAALIDVLKAAGGSGRNGADPCPPWGEAYVRWELGLLGELGYGVDLSACAATGRNDGLAFVSPKSGRAVSLSAGEPYRAKLLPLPPFLVGGGPPGVADVADGLLLTGYFLDKHVFAPYQRRLPAARWRLAERFA